MIRTLLRLALISMIATAPAAAFAQVGSSPVEARRTVHGFGACVADQSPEKAAETLHMDFRSTSYRSALRNLAAFNQPCLRTYGKLRSGGLLFAGAIAERLITKDPTPLNARLVAAAAKPGSTARSTTDAMALCVVRSAPDEVTRLFATQPGSSAEAPAAGALDLARRLCTQGKLRIETSVEGLRAMLATAAFRVLSAPAPERG